MRILGRQDPRVKKMWRDRYTRQSPEFQAVEATLGRSSRKGINRQLSGHSQTFRDVHEDVWGLREQARHRGPCRGPARCRCGRTLCRGCRSPPRLARDRAASSGNGRGCRCRRHPSQNGFLQSPRVSRRGESRAPSDWWSLDHVSEPLTTGEAEEAACGFLGSLASVSH